MRNFFLLNLIIYSFVCRAQNDSAKKEEPYKIILEQEPRFPGGEKEMISFIEKNLIYPKIAIDSGKEGNVKLRFKVDTTGLIYDITIVRNGEKLGFGLEEAAIEVVKKMPRWIPGSQNGVVVPMLYTLTVSFKLPAVKVEKMDTVQSELSPNYSMDAEKELMPDNVFLISTLKPQFPGGKEAMINFISQTLTYPKQAIENKIEGKVILKFIIDSLGKICCIEVIGKPIGYGLEEEAIRIVKAMPQWTPAYIDDEPVAVYYRLPITFKYYEE